MSTTSPNSDSSKSPQSNSLEESSREDSDATICFLSGKKCRGSLTIVDKLNCMYEDRMSQIEKRGSGKDCVKAKISVQRSWIGDLKEQNAALREVLEELEREALKRVEMLERKLRTSEQELAERTARAQGTEDQLKKATENEKTSACCSKQLSDRVKALEDEKRKLQAELDVLRPCTKKAEIERDDYKRKCTDCTKQIEELSSSLEMEKDNCRRSRQEVCNLQKDCENNKQLLEKTKRDSENAILTIQKSFQAEIVIYEDKQKTSYQTIVELREELDKVKEENRVSLEKLCAFGDKSAKPPCKTCRSFAVDASFETVDVVTGPSQASLSSKEKDERDEQELGSQTLSCANLKRGKGCCPEMRKQVVELERQLQEAQRSNQLAREEERGKRCQEVKNLQDTIRELENALKCSREYGAEVQQNDCMDGLRCHVRRLQQENAQYEKAICYLKQEMQNMSEHLSNLHEILSASNANSIQETTVLNETLKQLQATNDALQRQLAEEMDVNGRMSAHVRQLEQLLSQKAESCPSVECLRQKLEAAGRENDELRATVVQLQNEIRSFQEDGDNTEERAASGITHCQCILKSLRDKLGFMKLIIRQKTDEVTKLQNDCRDQVETIAVLRRDSENEKKHYNEDVMDLRHTVRELNDKLNKSEAALDRVNEELKANHKNLLESTKANLNKLSEAADRERTLTKQMHKLQTDDALLRNELSKLRKDQTQRFSCAAQNNPQLAAARQEICSLNQEINQLVQLQSRIGAENDKLKEQLMCLRGSVAAYRDRAEAAEAELNQCLMELQQVHAEKEMLEINNEELSQELISLRSAFKRLNRGNVSNAERELSAANCTELCAVGGNVKGSPAEQKQGNSQTANQLRQKERHNPRKSRSGACEWSAASQGTSSTGRSNPASSSGSGRNWYGCSQSEGEGEGPQQCLVDRVESMTQDLQRTNDYWKNRLSDDDVSKDK